MSLEILLITFVLVGILLIWHLDRSGYYERDEDADELERRIEEQSAQIAQLVRALESRPERRPRVTVTQSPVEPETAPRQRYKRQIRITHAKRIELIDRARLLRSQGLSFDDIAKALRVSESTARKYVRSDGEQA